MLDSLQCFSMHKLHPLDLCLVVFEMFTILQSTEQLILHLFRFHMYFDCIGFFSLHLFLHYFVHLLICAL